MLPSWARSSEERPAVAPRPGTPPGRLVGARYQVLNELGRGAASAVHRVLDRLTGRVVTLKRLKVESPPDATRGPQASRDDRLALAQEFRLLASLRHPNIISVLDYGFDEERQPYFTMDLEENARTIIDAGRGEPLAVQVDLLVQTLRALAYLHRHGIIHRDLKPANILVVKDQVKVLDFGLSVHRETPAARGGRYAGTLAYMAPEVLRGDAVTERADLYGLGMVAFELLVGRYPFERNFQHHIFNTLLPRPEDELDARLRPILGGLLAKSADARPHDPTEVIAAFAAALELPFSAETVATRESFLQAAPLVSRTAELNQLDLLQRAAVKGNGSAWLVGGESGVGKSRLLDEVRTRALVDGVVVVRSQGMGPGGAPYHVWRDVLRHLILRIDLGGGDAGVLKALVPDVGTLLGRAVPDPPELESESAQTRLFFAVEEVFRLQPEPTVVILEDLHSVGSESLKLFAWLARAVGTLPVFLLGSYRDDEAPDLPRAVGPVRTLTLCRMDAREVALLGEAMIGPTGRRPDVVRFLARETEGIPFFVVEVVRSLAESAGGLAHIAERRLPMRVAAGGMQKVIRRRLNQVPPDALAPLKTAAVVGRTIDPALLLAIHPGLDLQAWTDVCAGAAVLRLEDEAWRFAHDKLREQLLDDLSSAHARELHRRVAEAIEGCHAEGPERITALAHHWHHAGEATEEMDYAHQAGVLALRSGAYQEAIGHLKRARDLLRLPLQGSAPRRRQGAAPSGEVRPHRASRLDPTWRVDPDSVAFRLGMVEGGLNEAHYRLGDVKGCIEHAERALVHFGARLPSGRIGWTTAAARQAILRALQMLRRVRADDPSRARRVASEIARVQWRYTETCYYSLRPAPLIWSTLRLVNHCVPAGPSPDLAQAYTFLALLVGLVPVPRLAERLARRALALAEETGTRHDLAWALSRVSVFWMGTCRWDDADAALGQASAIAEEVGDLRLWEESRAQIGQLSLYTGQFERGRGLYREAHRLSRRSGNRQVECWGLIGQGDQLLRLGRSEEALHYYNEATGKLDSAVRTECIWTFGMTALAHLRMGDERAAYEAADRTVAYILAAPPVAYWTQQGTAAAAEVLLTLLERSARFDGSFRATLAVRARQVCAGLRRFARRFPNGRPHALLWQGLHAWCTGRRRRALRLWRRTIAIAEHLGTPYERSRAHLEIGRHLPVAAGRRAYHLHQAVEGFEALGCEVELAAARRELALDAP